jgi:riboflavin kinase/FMN adenylyltransferase
MEVITDLNSFTKPENAIVTQGTFDGVHIGHAQILGNIVALSKKQGGKSVLVTFHPHPRHFLYKAENNIRLLSTFDEKVEYLKKLGLDYLVVLPFDEQLAKMSAISFIRDILVEKIGVKTMVVGYDHRFGRNREGSFEDLKEYSIMFGFEVIEIAAQDISEAIVSSTKIRQSLLDGDVKTAALFLGRNYSLKGIVIHGRKMGKDLGYPTANIKVSDEDKLIPANGVYAVKVIHNNSIYGGMLNIGNNPSISGAVWSIEVHIFNFSNSIYGEELTVEFVSRMRNEEKFDTLDDLIAQLKVDEISSKEILKSKTN